MSHGSDDAACDVPTAPNKPAATSVTAAAADSSHLLKGRRSDRGRGGRRNVSANKNGRGIRLVAVIGRPSSGGSLWARRVTVRLEGHSALSAGFLIAGVGTRSGWLPGSYVQGAPSARGRPQLSG